MSADSCGAHNTPWCYVKEKNPGDPRYDTCAIPNCSCGKTFLRYTKFDQNQRIPWDLSQWKSSDESKAFINLIDPWTQNKPCTDEENCPSMCKTSDSSEKRDRRSTDEEEYDETEETVGRE